MKSVIERFFDAVDFRRYKNGEPMPRELAFLGLIGETGEVADILKKHLWHGADLDREHFIEELGDVAWYAAALAWADCRRDPRPRTDYLKRSGEDVAGMPGGILYGQLEFSNAHLDTLGYVEALAAWAGATLDDVLEANMAKLDRRYPNGFVEGGGVR